MFRPEDLFDLEQTAHAELFGGIRLAWEALHKLEEYVKQHARADLKNTCEGVAFIGSQVSIGEGTVVEDGAMIKGPAIIGRNCHIRHNAYIREMVLIGDDCVVGNACEVRHSILFNGVIVPHMNYIGNSILGHQAHLGAGVKLSNYRLMVGNITVAVDGKPQDTGLAKLGALVGDRAEVGCNAVLNPGSIIGRNCVIYPNVNWRGILPANQVAKNKAEIEVTVRRP